MESYGKHVAEVIIGDCCNDMVVFKENGVWPSDHCLASDTSHQFHWNFACDLDGPDVQDALEAPSLPIPFTANQLAVFMLDGVGVFVQLFYGEWEDGPDEEKLQRMGIRARKPREALRAAYVAFLEAQKIVGELDKELELRASRLAAIYRKKNAKANAKEGVFADGISIEERSARRNRAKESGEYWRKCSHEAKKRFDAAFFTWRKAMVNQLAAQKVTNQSQVNPQSDAAIVEPVSKPVLLPVLRAAIAQPEIKTISHSLKTRIQALDAEISEAKNRALKKNEPASVWAELVKMAEAKPPVGALIGFSSDGIQYRGPKYQAKGEPDTFTVRNLRNRLAREAKRTKPR